MINDFKKVNLKDAKYAHVSKDKIKIFCMKKIQGVEAEYTIEVPNTIGFNFFTKNNEPRSFYFSKYMVRYLKDVNSISYYENNSSQNSIAMGARIESVILHTKKGEITSNKVHLNGKTLCCPDIEAIYH